MRPAGVVPARFFLAVLLAAGAAIALALSLVFGPATYADVARLGTLRYHDLTFRYFPISLTESSFYWARGLLLGLAGGAVLAGATQLARGGALVREWAALWREWRAAPPLLAPWRALRPAERRTAALLLAGLTLARLYYVHYYPLYGDELVTYLSFVRPGPVAALSFYPVPNNHLLYTGLCWMFSLVSTNFYWVMRAPVFLIGTLGPAGVGLLLLRQYGFRVAAWAVLLGGWLPYALFQSVVGRGYFLLAVAGQLALLAGLALGRGTGQPRLAWTVWISSCIIGFHAVPTFLLLFVGLAGALALSRRVSLGQLALAAAVVGAAVALLYAPVLVVSGPAALLGNAYVAPGAGHAAGLSLGRYLLRTDGQVLGLGPLGLPLALALTAGGLAAACRWPAVRPARGLLGAAALLVWLPYALLVLGEVYPPTRVLAFRGFYVLLPGAVLADALLRTRRLPRWLGRPAVAVALPVALAAGVVLAQVQRRSAPEQRHNARVAHCYEWLRAHGARAVLADDPHYQLFMSFFSEQRAGELRIEATPQPGRHYDFQLVAKDAARHPLAGARLVAENADVRIYRLR